MSRSRRVTRARKTREVKSFLGAVWLGLAIVWFGGTLASSFVMGAMVVALPFFSFLREWGKEVSLYDLLTGVGYWWSVLMAVIGVTIFNIFPISTGEPEPYIVTRFAICALGVSILALLVVGKLIG